MKNLPPEERIIFALDVPALDEAVRYARLLKDHVGLFKVGLELFVAGGPRVVKMVKEESSKGVFLDLKFHDIPATVRGACLSASRLGAEFMTVHCEGARGIREALGGLTGVKILGVTVLTSLSEEDFLDMGIDPGFRTTSELVLHRAGVAKEAGLAGVVCSGLEAEAVKKRFGPDFTVVVPGIRLEKYKKGADDQKRVVTPYEAIKGGADYIVVGRPIKNAPDPRKTAEEIAREIEEALQDRGA